jgi:hypothetical protein
MSPPLNGTVRARPPTSSAAAEQGCSDVYVGGNAQIRKADWIRLYRPDGTVVPLAEEQAEAEREQAKAERQRAEAAEAELARLRALLKARGEPG